MQIIWGILVVVVGFILVTVVPPFGVLVVILGFITGLIARSKGRRVMGWWLYGMLIAIVAIPHALLLKPDLEGIERLAAWKGKKRCPECAEFVPVAATKCKSCGARFETETPSPA